jgi:hypothetical protein
VIGFGLGCIVGNVVHEYVSLVLLCSMERIEGAFVSICEAFHFFVVGRSSKEALG